MYHFAALHEPVDIPIFKPNTLKKKIQQHQNKNVLRKCGILIRSTNKEALFPRKYALLFDVWRIRQRRRKCYFLEIIADIIVKFLTDHVQLHLLS